MPNLNRKVYGQVRRPNGQPWVGAVVKITLKKSSFTATASYPTKTEEITTGPDGRWETYLWCSGEGIKPTKFACQEASYDPFDFNLVYGDGAPIHINVLRAAGLAPITPTDPVYAVVEAMLGNVALPLKRSNGVLELDYDAFVAWQLEQAAIRSSWAAVL